MRYWLLFSLVCSLSVFGCEDSGALGEGCSSSSDCTSDLCVDTGMAGQICSQLCDIADATTCPTGYACTAAGAASVCIPDAMTMPVGGMDMPVGGMDMPVGGMDMPVGGMDMPDMMTMPVGGMDMPVGGMDMPVGGMDMPVGGIDMDVPNDCPDIVMCANTCADQNCIQDCFNSGNAEGQSRFNDLLGCIQGSVQNGTCGQEDFECQNQACGTELTACVGEQGPTMTGNLSCSDLNTCFGMCDPNDQNCIQGCFNNATAAAQSEYGAIITCAQSSGCAENDNACLNMVCATEIQACLGG